MTLDNHKLASPSEIYEPEVKCVKCQEYYEQEFSTAENYSDYCSSECETKFLDHE